MISPNIRHQYVGGFRRRLPGRSASQRNLKLQIEYEGTNYAGWQVQNSRQSSVVSRQPSAVSRQKKTIQQVIEKTLRKILREKVHLIVSGRTDAGVHALAQAANFKTKSNIPAAKLRYALNGLLPSDITVSEARDVPAGFHSRLSAKSKIYRYLILNRAYPSALLRSRVYYYPYPLDLPLMRKEARSLLGRHDFSSFCASGSNSKTTVRVIKKITIKEIEYPLSARHNPLAGVRRSFVADAIRYPLIAIDIEADGFLYNMVRNIAGTLIELGRGRFKPGDLKRILLAKDRKAAGPTAPARGLYLMKVNY